MARLTVSDNLNNNPLTQQQTREFLEFASRDGRLSEAFKRIREICSTDYLERDDQQNEELEELGLFVSNFAIRYGRSRQMPPGAFGFLRRAAEQHFAKDEDQTTSR